MFPLLAFVVPTLVEALFVSAATATVVTVVSRATSDAYDKATKEEDDKD